MTLKLPETREMIRQLVAIPSTSSADPALDLSNSAVVEALGGWAEGAGFRVEVRPVPGLEGKLNLVATLGSGPGGLVLSGHTDTVPFDARRWRTDPLEATERDGCIYGRGTADMKSFLALALEAASGFDAGDLAEPVVVVATADEESTMSGARALRDAGRPLGRRAILGEPTELRPIVAHKGILTRTIRVTGRAGHSSDPSLGSSALEGMHQVIAALLGYRDDLARSHRDGRFAVPQPTLNLGCIHGGDAPNRICARCELSMDLRPLPGMSTQEVEARLGACVAEALAGSGLSHDIERPFDGVEAFEAAADSVLARAAERWTGLDAGAVSFGTEAPLLAELGIDTIVMGPGSIDVAHQPDEHLPLESLPRTVSLLRRAIERFCVRGDAS